jgi:predicted AAA+ superfamily ATPase
MKRYATKDLIAWKNAKHRKPLILRGARQVGKTWLMKNFGAEYYEDTAYIDFHNNARIPIYFLLRDEHSAL